ncbi:MAG TPA: phosphoribosylformylglycinamidine cyclo-ligase [Gemmatimonadales bacterium]
MSGSRYAAAGVDLDSAEAAKQRIGELVRGARTAYSAGRIGAFGGMVRVPEEYRCPLLVMSTDGVGTKVMVAREAGRFDTVGEDLVNHSVNDILVHGARPLAFLDYVAGAGLTVAETAGIVEGVARGCRAHRMALAGGETAQMPGLYRHGDFDLAGTIVGVVEESRAIHGDAITPGDALVALASSGLHTNGYTLARRILFERMKLGLDAPLPGAGETVADALLAVHRSYWAALEPVLDRIHGMAHITGGGIPGNLVRVLPEGCEAVVDSGSWRQPPLFELLAREGDVTGREMREVFNLGVGMIVVLPAADVEAVRASAGRAGIPAWVLGEIRSGAVGVRFA